MRLQAAVLTVNNRELISKEGKYAIKVTKVNYVESKDIYIVNTNVCTASQLTSFLSSVRKPKANLRKLVNRCSLTFTIKKDLLLDTWIPLEDEIVEITVEKNKKYKGKNADLRISSMSEIYFNETQKINILEGVEMEPEDYILHSNLDLGLETEGLLNEDEDLVQLEDNKALQQV